MRSKMIKSKSCKQKVKNIEEKIVKDFAEITKVARQSKESANLITKLRENNVKLQQNYVDEDNILEELKKNSKELSQNLMTVPKLLGANTQDAMDLND
ncbi:hypothetical protein Tco_1206388 [Tanacetum coccineum]